MIVEREEYTSTNIYVLESGTDGRIVCIRIGFFLYRIRLKQVYKKNNISITILLWFNFDYFLFCFCYRKKKIKQIYSVFNKIN